MSESISAIREFAAAILTRFGAEGNFTSALTGGLHFIEAPEEVDNRYATFTMSEIAWHTFGYNFESMVVTFTIVSESDNADELLDLFEKMKQCFDEQKLEMPHYMTIRFWRVRSGDIQRLDRFYTVDVEYNAELEQKVT